MTALCPMTRPKVPPEDLPLFQQLVAHAKSNGNNAISEAEYQQLEDTFIAAQGRPGTPTFLWGLGHRQILKSALAAAGVSVQ